MRITNLALRRSRRLLRLALTHLPQHDLDAAIASNFVATIRDVDAHDLAARQLRDQVLHDLRDVEASAATGCRGCANLRGNAERLHDELERLT